MKAIKKIQKRLDARMRDYQKTIENSKDDAKAFHAPGSRKKVS